MKVSVVGAPGTGKTRLAGELSQALHARGHRHVVVQEGGAPPDAGLTLLMGLDLPGPAGREEADSRLRQSLALAGIAYRVVYGQGEARTRNALAPVLALLGEHPAADQGAPRWQWSCDKCSDPECEHRLFTGRLSLRA